MSLLRLLEEAQGGQAIGQLAERFGMERGQADGLARMLAPAIGSAARRRAERGGLESVVGQLMGEREAGYFDDPRRAADDEGRAQGERFLEQLLGSREASRDLAAEAGRRAGVAESAAAEFLPALAAMLQGGMQRRMPDTTLQGLLGAGATARGQGGGGLMGLVMGMLGGGRRPGQADGGLSPLLAVLDADGDGSVLDDVLDRLMR